MPMFTLPVHAQQTTVQKKPSKITIATFKDEAELAATIAVWRTPVQAETAPRARCVGMTSGATTSTTGYESTDDVVLNETTFKALGARTNVLTASLAEPTEENEALVLNLSDAATNGTGQVSRKVLNTSGILPIVAVCKDYVGSGQTWRREISAQAEIGTDDVARESGVETNVSLLPLSVRSTQREGYDLVEYLNFGAADAEVDTTP